MLLHREKTLHTEGRFYTQESHRCFFLHADAFYMQVPLHRGTRRSFIHRVFFTQTVFKHRSFCTGALTHTCLYAQKVFTHRKLLHSDSVPHTESLTRRRVYTQKLLHREAITRRNLYHTCDTTAFTHNLLHMQVSTQKILQRNFSTKMHTHMNRSFPGAFTRNSCLHVLRRGMVSSTPSEQGALLAYWQTSETSSSLLPSSWYTCCEFVVMCL